jgi:hypothetical protein
LVDKPVWFTETGFPTNNVTDGEYGSNNSLSKQALFMKEDFSLLTSFSQTRAILWWDLVGYTSGYYFGLFNSTNYTPQQPTMSVFESYAKTSISTSPSITTTSSTSVTTISSTIMTTTSSTGITTASDLSTSAEIPSSPVFGLLATAIVVVTVVVLASFYIIRRRLKRGNEVSCSC